MIEFIAKFSSWPPRNRWLRPLWLPATTAQRVPGIINSHRYDLTLLQREMVSTLVTLERITKRPRIMDVDDAVWLNPRGDNFKRLLKICDAGICGNSFLAEYVGTVIENILVMPTLVDTERFRPATGEAINNAGPVIGWSGLHAGSKYLYAIERPLKVVLEKYPDAVLRVVSDRPLAFSKIPKQRVQFIRWSPEVSVEVRSLQEMTVGLMPIDDSLWSRGKCSYKMLLYMSCGVPVVVSPFGMNAEVLEKGQVGFGAKSDDEWVDAISALIDDSTLRTALGDKARSVVLDHYSISSQLPYLADFIRKVKNG